MNSQEVYQSDMQNVGLNMSALVLAAGSSSRLGEPKQLVQYQGESLLRRTVKNIMHAGIENTLVVTGYEHELISGDVSDLPVEVFFNEDWKSGQGTSIAKGLQTILKHQPEIDSVLITPCDQPFITSDHLKNLIKIYRSNEKMIIATGYSETFGVPLLVDKFYFCQIPETQWRPGRKKDLKAISETN